MEVNGYMKLPYTRLVQEMNDESLNEAMEGYIETKLENHLFIQFSQAEHN